MNFREVIRAAKELNDVNFIQWCSQNEVIRNINNRPLCRRCGVAMHVEYSVRNTDGACWRCHLCRGRLSIRYNTWCSRSTLSLRSLVKVLAHWCDCRTVNSTSTDLNIDEGTIRKKFDKFRSVADRLYRNDLAQHPFGGMLPVQIDESHFYKAKYDEGRMTGRAIWVFGIFDMNTDRVLMEIVEERNAETLLPIVRSTVMQGTTVWSDKWPAYGNLPMIGYRHETVNHSVEFVARNGVNTQTIEALWSAVKRRLCQCGLNSRDRLEDYIHEYCFRHNIASDFATCWHLINT